MGTNLGQIIAGLRKQMQMTQEDLAEAIGVSAQAISKWETSATYPDILLLPVIADTFNVSIDTLFGRKGKLPANNDIFTHIEEVFLDTLHAYFNDFEGPDSEAEERARYKEALKADDRQNTAIVRRGKSMVLYNSQTGAAVLKCPEGGWASIFDDYGTTLQPLFERLADGDFAIMMGAILSKEDYSFTANSVAKKTGLPQESIRSHIGYLVRAYMLNAKVLEIDDEAVTVYSINPETKLIPLFAVLACGIYFHNFQAIYKGFIGDPGFYLPDTN